MDAPNSSNSFDTKVRGLNMLKFVSHWGYRPHGQFTKFKKELFDKAKNLYRKDLIGHYGCVNAIEFSNDGNYLYSGGDDLRILMWDINNAIVNCTNKYGDGGKAVAMKSTHTSNIFCLAVDNQNNRVLSGGNDHNVIVHDIPTGHPADTIIHCSPIFSISVYPENGHIFVSAVDDGKLAMFDTRQFPHGPVEVAVEQAPYHGVMFNPVESNLVASANSKFGIHIWDIRRPRVFVKECTHEQSLSVRWNPSGSMLLGLRNLLPPILYNPQSDGSGLDFDSLCYYNACTMKSCCFAGDNAEFILAGSDDFNLYMWKIPEPWPEENLVGEAHLVLTGHRSIVNQVRYSPEKRVIVTSGVEKMIKLWSPLPLPYTEGNRSTPPSPRPRVLGSTSSGPFVPFHARSLEEDPMMIHFFDSLLLKELECDQRHTSASRCPQTYLKSLRNRRTTAKIKAMAFQHRELVARKKKYLSVVMQRQEGN